MAMRYDKVDYTFPAVAPADAVAAMFGDGTPLADAARRRMLARQGISKPEAKSATEAREKMVERQQGGHK